MLKLSYLICEVMGLDKCLPSMNSDFHLPIYLYLLYLFVLSLSPILKPLFLVKKEKEKYYECFSTAYIAVQINGIFRKIYMLRVTQIRICCYLIILSHLLSLIMDISLKKWLPLLQVAILGIYFFAAVSRSHVFRVQYQA